MIAFDERHLLGCAEGIEFVLERRRVVEPGARDQIELSIDDRQEQVHVPLIGHAVCSAERDDVRLKRELLVEDVGGIVLERRISRARWIVATVVVLETAELQVIEVAAVEAVEIQEQIRDTELEAAGSLRSRLLDEGRREALCRRLEDSELLVVAEAQARRGSGRREVRGLVGEAGYAGKLSELAFEPFVGI